MEKNFFDFVNSDFFAPFSNENKRLNYDLLQLINNKLSLDNLQVEKEEIAGWIIDYVENHPTILYSENEDGSIESNNDPRTFAFAKIRYFIDRGWLIEDTEGTKRTYQMDEVGIRILETMDNVVKDVANIAGGMLSDSSSSDSDNDRAEEQRIQNLKDALADLIDQAKTDAEYYQKNLMHKNALATNESISTRSYDVNDAIITPNGNVVSTHPDDYLIATKTPEQFLNGGSSGVNLQVNSIINNNSSNVTATTETVENADGSIDIITTICDVVNSGLAEGKFDDGLAAYDYRQQGRSVAS